MVRKLIIRERLGSGLKISDIVTNVEVDYDVDELCDWIKQSIENIPGLTEEAYDIFSFNVSKDQDYAILSLFKNDERMFWAPFYWRVVYTGTQFAIEVTSSYGINFRKQITRPADISDIIRECVICAYDNEDKFRRT